MPLTLSDYKRPPQDNGRGIAGYPAAGWKGGEQGIEHWIGELQQLGIKWLRVIDDNGSSLDLCERLLRAGIFPIVRILRRDLPPNDSPEPNPGHISAREEVTIKKLIDAGVLYLETNNEPDNPAEWKQHAIPGSLEEAAKLVALNWLFDARFIIEAGGYPGLPSVSSGSEMDLLGALASLGRQDILLDGGWIAVHNFGHNRPLNFPNDRVNQNGAPVTAQEYDFGPMSQWVWWDGSLGRANTLDEINAQRAQRKQAGQVIVQDHAAFREYEYFDALAKKHLGRSIPILATEGGYQVGQRTDLRYPRVTPALQADLTVAIYEYMQRDAPESFFATCPSMLVANQRNQAAAWYSDFWDRAIRSGNATGTGDASARNPGRLGNMRGDGSEVPPVAVPDYRVGERLPVVAAVKAMQSVSRTGPRVAVPQPAPVPVAMPSAAITPPPPPPQEENIYLVQHGDTLSSIAKKFSVPLALLASTNSLADNARVIAGQRLVVPPPPAVTLPEMPAEAPPMIAASQAQRQPANHQPAMPEWFAAPPAPAASVAATAYLTQPQRAATAGPAADASTFGVPPRPPRAPGMASPLDPRLAALNVRVDFAKVRPGESYWKLLRAEYQDPAQAAGNHHMIYNLIDDKGKPVLVQRVFQGLADIQADSFTDAFGRAKIPMWESYRPDDGEQGAYSAWVAGLPSDKVIGMGMPNGMAVNYVLTWQKSVK